MKIVYETGFFIDDKNFLSASLNNKLVKMWETQPLKTRKYLNNHPSCKKQKHGTLKQATVQNSLLIPTMQLYYNNTLKNIRQKISLSEKKDFP